MQGLGVWRERLLVVLQQSVDRLEFGTRGQLLELRIGRHRLEVGESLLDLLRCGVRTICCRREGESEVGLPLFVEQGEQFGGDLQKLAAEHVRFWCRVALGQRWHLAC